MLLHIEIETGNAAFHDPDCAAPDAPDCCDGFAAEIPKVLERIGRKVAQGEKAGGALDTNGNTCSTFWFEDVE